MPMDFTNDIKSRMIIAWLEGNLSEKRCKHSIGVAQTALEMAQRNQADEYKAWIAGLLHDCAREIKKEDMLSACRIYGIVPDAICMVQTELLHAQISAVYAEHVFGVEDVEILNAIRCHTTGKPEMSVLDRIIYVADCIEPGRKYEGVKELRKIADVDLNRALIRALNDSIRYIVDKNALLHPDTVAARNAVLSE